jgi:hypothetical protein
MSEYMFGLHSGHLTARADTIAKRHGAWHVNYTEPRGKRRGWFACPNRGSPFDQAVAKRVREDIDRAGGIDALMHARDVGATG